MHIIVQRATSWIARSGNATILMDMIVQRATSGIARTIIMHISRLELGLLTCPQSGACVAAERATSGIARNTHAHLASRARPVALSSVYNCAAGNKWDCAQRRYESSCGEQHVEERAQGRHMEEHIW